MTPQAFQSLTEQAHARVGLAMAERFRLPAVVGVYMGDPNEFDTVDRRSLANVLRLAKSIAQTAGAQLGPFDEAAAQARIVIGRSLLDVRDDTVGHLVNAALTVARAAVAWLSSGRARGGRWVPGYMCSCFSHVRSPKRVGPRRTN